MVHDIILGRNKHDLEKFGEKGIILLAKQYVTMGRNISLSNKIYMDVAKAHVVFVVGKRGSGKCLHEDTLITLNDGSQTKIKDLEHNEEQIISMNSKYKLNSSKKEGFYKRDVSRILTLKLRSGKEIKLTPEHPLFTIKGWLPCKELNIGSRIATPRELKAFGNGLLEEDKIKLLAYLIAEGHLSNNFVLFSNQDKKIVCDFKNSLNTFDNLKVNNHGPYTYRIVKKEKRNKVKILERDNKGRILKVKNEAKSTLRTWLEEVKLYGELSRGKFIPEEIFKLPKNRISLFLNRLFSCDGCIHKYNEHWFVSYCSNSKKLINQVHHLLLRFGVLSKIRTKKHAYEIVVYGENVPKFIKEIGFYGEKQKKQKKALSESIAIERNPNTDTIPKDIWDLYRPTNWAKIGRQMNYAHPKALRESKRYCPSRQKLIQIATLDENELIQEVASSDIFWDEITSIEENEGCFTVYDISVPETNNFVANDIIVHNSYTMGAIAEGAASMNSEVSQNLSFIILDTMGIYWTMKYENLKDKELLTEWGLDGKGLDVKIFTPTGFFEDYKKKGIPTDEPFSIRPAELLPQDWFLTFGLDMNEPLAVFIENTLNNLKAKATNYGLKEIIEQIKKADAKTSLKTAAINRFENASTWGVFSKTGTTLESLSVGGQITVLDVSAYATSPNGWAIKSLVIGLVAQKLFNERMLMRKNEEFEAIQQMTTFGVSKKSNKMEKPLVWLVIDEAHEFLPLHGETAATTALITILREGRQPGISLVLATQQPGKIHTDVMTQSDIIISHRITARLDIDALKMLSASYMTKGIDDHLRILPRVPGAALIIDDKNERIFSTRIRPRSTWHGGEAPTAIKESKKLF